MGRLGLMTGWLAALAACGGGTDPVYCTEEYRAGITVEVVHGVTGAPLAESATLTLREGDYVETVTEPLSGRYLSGAWERAGTYDVRIDLDGFVPWRSAGIVVAEDVCHVHTVALTAPMVEVPGP